MNLPAIRSAACAEFKCDPVDFASPRRFREAVDARHTAMWVVRTETGMSYPAIARKFGGIDHTSVMHAVSRIEHRIETDPAFAARVNRMKENVSGSAKN